MKKKRRREGESPPPLTAEQQELVLRYARTAARTALVLTAGCRRLIDEDEATSLGYFALCRAAGAFDPSFGVNFWTFARVAIRRIVWAKSTIEDRHVHYQLDSAAEREAHPVDYNARRRLRRVAEWAHGHAEREALVESVSRAGRGDPRRRHLLQEHIPRHRRGWGIEVAA